MPNQMRHTRQETTYFQTAEKMDNALLELLETKDFEYITVKELCQKAGVNRSTFYLHYQNLSELLEECVEFMNADFLAHMDRPRLDIAGASLDELYLVREEYLLPYLTYVREHRRAFATVQKHAKTFGLAATFERMFRHIFSPLLERFGVPEADRAYMVTFYIHGIMSILSLWIRSGCEDSVEHIMEVIEKCVPKR